MRFNFYALAVAAFASLLVGPAVAYYDTPDHHLSSGVDHHRVARELVERLIGPVIDRALERRSDMDYGLEKRVILSDKSCGDARKIVAECAKSNMHH